MLACARIGAIHSVVFGGFASSSLASRIDDAEPTVVVARRPAAAAARRALQGLLDEAIRLAAPEARQGADDRPRHGCVRTVAGRDVDYAAARGSGRRRALRLARVDGRQLTRSTPRHGQTQGVQRDTGGYAVALAASMKAPSSWATPARPLLDQRHRLGRRPQLHRLRPAARGHGDHLLRGSLPTRPDAGIWWSLVEVQGHGDVLGADRGARCSKRTGGLPKRTTCPRCARSSRRRAARRADRAVDLGALKRPIIDNYWQTESGWPILALPTASRRSPQVRQPGLPMYGYDVKLLDEKHRRGVEGAGTRRAWSRSRGPLPPGCMQTVWATTRFVNTYWKSVPEPTRLQHLRLGGARRGRLLLHPRPHRRRDQRRRPPPLRTREIEESISGHPTWPKSPSSASPTSSRGRVAMAFVVPKDATAVADTAGPDEARGRHREAVDNTLGAVARPARCASSAVPRRRAQASCCAARSRPCEAAIPAT